MMFCRSAALNRCLRRVPVVAIFSATADAFLQHDIQAPLGVVQSLDRIVLSFFGNEDLISAQIADRAPPGT